MKARWSFPTSIFSREMSDVSKMNIFTKILKRTGNVSRTETLQLHLCLSAAAVVVPALAMMEMGDHLMILFS